MLIIPPILSHHFHPGRRTSFAMICHVCLRVWAVYEDKPGQGFLILRHPCRQCGFTPADINRRGNGPTVIPGSVLEELINWTTELTPRPGVIRGIIDVLPEALIRSEFQAHLSAFIHTLKEAQQCNA